jgi:hypothetical protein
MLDTTVWKSLEELTDAELCTLYRALLNEVAVRGTWVDGTKFDMETWAELRLRARIHSEG